MAALLFPELQFFDADGNPLASGTIYTYTAGTTTPVATYTNSTGGTSVGTSIPLNADGRPNSGNGIWLGTTTTYKFVVKDSSGATVQTIDNISSGGFNGSSNFVVYPSDSGLTNARALTAGTGIGLTDGGAGGAVTVATKSVVNSQTGTTYTAVAADNDKIIRMSGQSTATLSLTAAATLGDGWKCYVVNDNSGNLTIDPNGTENINGSSSSEVIPTGSKTTIICDGTRFHSFYTPKHQASTLTLTQLGDLGAITTTTISASGDISVIGGYGLAATNNISTSSGNISANNGSIEAEYSLRVEQKNINLTGNTNDLTLTSALICFTSTGAYDLTGLDGTNINSGAYTGVVTLVNTSANTITIKHESASSSANNRFKISTGADYSLTANKSKQFIYDGVTSSRWRDIE